VVSEQGIFIEWGGFLFVFPSALGPVGVQAGKLIRMGGGGGKSMIPLNIEIRLKCAGIGQTVAWVHHKAI